MENLKRSWWISPTDPCLGHQRPFAINDGMSTSSAQRTVTSPCLKVRCRALVGQNSTVCVTGGIDRFWPVFIPVQRSWGNPEEADSGHFRFLASFVSNLLNWDKADDDISKLANAAHVIVHEHHLVLCNKGDAFQGWNVFFQVVE